MRMTHNEATSYILKVLVIVLLILTYSLGYTTLKQMGLKKAEYLNTYHHLDMTWEQALGFNINVSAVDVQFSVDTVQVFEAEDK